ncbi:MAG: GAF domain-containing protein [Anaerolineae bacterium]|nr:GAF domain-containing protein [Anaerolineae bacterium]
MDMQEILSKVITSTNEIFQAEAGSVALLDPSGQNIVIRAAVGAGADAVRGLRLPIGQGVMGWVFSNEEPALIPDVYADERFFKDVDKESGFQTRAILCVPMKADGHTIGVIELMNMRPDYLSDDGVKILSVIADHAALAIENARLLEETRQKSEEQAFLFEAMAIVTSDLALDTVLDAVGRQMVEALKADLCIISRWPLRQKQLDIMQAYAGPGVKRPSPAPRPLLEGSTALTVLTSQNSTYLDVDASDISPEEKSWVTQLRMKTLFLIPLIYRRQTIGLVEIGRIHNLHSLTAGELRLAETMTAQAAVAIEHARLYDEATRHLAEAKVLQEVMVAAASTLDFNQVLTGTIEALHRTLGIERLGFFLPPEEDTNFIITHPATVGFDLKNGRPEIPLEGSAIGWVIRNNKDILLRDVRQFSDYYELAADTLSELCVPVRLKDKVVAVLNAESPRLDAFDNEDLRLFRAIAAELAVALENAQLFQTEHRLVNQQKALINVFADLNTELTSETLFQRIINQAIVVIPQAESGSLIIQQDEDFVHAAAVGFEIQKLKSLVIAQDIFLECQPPVRTAERLSRKEIIELGRHCFPTNFHQYAQAVHLDDVQCMLRTSLYAGDNVIGAITVASSTKPQAFTEEDEQVLLLFASQAAIALQNAYLFEETRAAEANYRDLFDNANDFIFTLDGSFRISSANKAVFKATGYQADEIIGMHFTEFVPSEHYARLYKILKSRLVFSDSPTTFELPVKGKDGREAVIEATIRVQRDNNRPVGLHCIARDITQRLELEQQLRQTEKLSTIGKLVAGVAHELNNPLTSIIGYSNLLQENDILQPYKDDLKVIFQQADRARIIVKDLLAFARKIDLEPKPVDINATIQFCLNLTKSLLHEHHVQVNTALDFGLPQTLADQHQLELVFVNLISNAVHALSKAETSPCLSIESKKLDDAILLTFADNGPGIPPGISHRIFDPFFSTKQVGEGTGLGLSICFGIISEHKGQIWVDETVTSGATFHVKLPIVPVRETTATAPDLPEPVSVPDSLPKYLHILAVDDEPPLLELLRRVLGRLGYTVDTASDGKIGLEKLNENNYDIIICDVLMPDILGPDLYGRAVKQFPHLHGSFIFITGNVVDPDTRIFLENSGSPWLAKPFLPKDIKRAITEVLNKKSEPTALNEI